MDYYTAMKKKPYLHTTWLNFRHKVEIYIMYMYIPYGFVYVMVKAGKPRP